MSSPHGYCYECKYQGSTVCNHCFAWSEFDRESSGKPKHEENDWWRDINQEDSSPSIGGYYSGRTGHAGYGYTNR